MTAAAIVAGTVTATKIKPGMGYYVAQVTYTKANAGDTLDVSTITPIQTILFAYPVLVSSGVQDASTFTGSTMTFTTATGVNSMLLVGTC